MSFGRIGITRPEDFPKQFNVYRLVTSTNATGRLVAAQKPELVGTIRGILSRASPIERNRYHQLGDDVSHKVIEWGSPTAEENDVLALVVDGCEKRFMRIAIVHNRGEMGICTTYYCIERGDAK